MTPAVHSILVAQRLFLKKTKDEFKLRLFFLESTNYHIFRRKNIIDLSVVADNKGRKCDIYK